MSPGRWIPAVNFNRENMLALFIRGLDARPARIIRRNEQTRFGALLPSVERPLDIMLDYG